jgi:membrane protein
VIKDTSKYWWRISRRAAQLWIDRNAFSHAGSLAFYTLFSLAPTVIIAVTVMGLVLGEDAARGQVVGQLQDIMGEEAAIAVEEAVKQSRLEEAGLWPTILGVGALIVGATTVFAQMQYSLNAIWDVTPKPTRNSIFILIKSRLLSLAVVVAIGFVLLVSLLLGVVVRVALNMMEGLVPWLPVLVGAVEFAMSFVIVGLLFAAIFKVLPDVMLTWKDVLSGAVITALLFSFGRYGIAAYLAYTAPASAYGAAGSVVLVLLWVYYSSLILLFGAAFTRARMQEQQRPIVPRNTAVVVRHELVEEKTA